MSKTYDIAIIGGGIVGTAVGMSLQKEKKLSVILIEAENKFAPHQTGNNSGVIHSGLYYKPGSLKAKNCTEGRALMYRFCEEYSIPYERCGKIVLAIRDNEAPILRELELRGQENGLIGIKRITKEEIKEHEPYANGVLGLYVPETGIVDYTLVTNKYVEIITENGGKVLTSTRFMSLVKKSGEMLLETNNGEIRARVLVNCAGLQSDRVAQKCGVNPNLHIIPFRGEYYNIVKEKSYLVNNLIYPVPDTKFPFLGVHFTRRINGGVEAGPNAVLAFKREGYKKNDFSLGDVFQMITYSGFWRMAGKHYKMGIMEFYRSFNKNKFVSALQKLVPEISHSDLYPGGAGVRAQALEPDGKLVDDFRIIESENMVHVLNAPSPAATASISIGRTIAALAEKRFKEGKG
ncbi:MAG: L-2-hydroxyglutarate oxidase [Ignavibacteriaceae bacterium]|nr:L-2-hydroxyglutarate oxidase [Ignavibacteriaceae bacterium]